MSDKIPEPLQAALRGTGGSVEVHPPIEYDNTFLAILLTCNKAPVLDASRATKNGALAELNRKVLGIAKRVLQADGWEFFNE